MTAAGRDGREQLVDFAILLEKGLWGSWGQAHRDQIASFVEASLDELVNKQTADVNAEVTDVNEPQWDDAAVLQDVAEKVILSTSQRSATTLNSFHSFRTCGLDVRLEASDIGALGGPRFGLGSKNLLRSSVAEAGDCLSSSSSSLEQRTLEDFWERGPRGCSSCPLLFHCPGFLVVANAGSGLGLGGSQ